jgi:hypothetical protein
VGGGDGSLRGLFHTCGAQNTHAHGYTRVRRVTQTHVHSHTHTYLPFLKLRLMTHLTHIYHPDKHSGWVCVQPSLYCSCMYNGITIQALTLFLWLIFIDAIAKSYIPKQLFSGIFHWLNYHLLFLGAQVSFCLKHHSMPAAS